MTPTIKNYSFKLGLPQEFEIVDLTQLFKEANNILTTTHRAGFYLGFNEPTNFIKFFKKHAQSTPVEFREKFLSA